MGRRGGQRKFSDHAIETALTLRLIFKLPLRQAEGFLRSVLALMDVDLEAPDHTTLSRRSQSLNVDLHRVAGDGPIHLIVDSTGISIVGEGEWAAAKHGARGRRGWKKLHIGVDRTGTIVAQILTHGSADDAKAALDLIDSIDGDIASISADTAYDTLAIYVENTFFRYKTIVAPRLRARHPKSQDAEAVTACNILNRMLAIGRPESFAIAD
jgi:IS5 family transposase